MLKAGTETGSLMNHLMSRGTGPEPHVGMGATILHWTDRTACTVVAVERFKTGPRAGTVKAVHVTYDTATRTDTNGMSETQEYTYTSHPDGVPSRFRLTKDGFRDSGGHGLMLGKRSHYHDFSF